MKKIALIGNPNTGKTSLFNQLTTSYAYVGNWSGVTVEKKVGKLKKQQGELIDLPGLYTLNPLTEDEAVVSNFLLNDSYTTILNIVDASQLLRNLHLTIQLLELGKPVIIGLNMTDVAEQYGTTINASQLSKKLNLPVVPIVARTGKGCLELGEQLSSTSNEVSHKFNLSYGAIIEKAITHLEVLLNDKTSLSKRWLAIQFFEGNSYVYKYLQNIVPKQTLDEIYAEVEKTIKETEGVFLHHYIYRKRNDFISALLKDVEEKSQTEKKTLTEKIDKIVTNRFLGIPIFLLTMFLVFMLTFDWLGFPLSDLLDEFLSGPFTDWTIAFLTLISATPFIEALIIDGIIAGVGGVLVFIPQIFIMYIFISFLEDSGYMARVALVMDRFMEKIGLNGKAFIPMIIGFGCNVPGVMAARTIEQPRERLLTIILMPLMSCSARLPVYALFAAAFFVKNQALVVFSLYFLGITIALILAKVFTSTLLKNESSIFVIELPPYRLPHWGTLTRSVWDKGQGFLKKAGTIIFAGSVFIWLLTYLGPGGVDVEMNDSFLALIGGTIAPLLQPLGFGTWQAGAALLTGFMAKEVVVSTMNIIYYAPDVESLQALMTSHYTALSAYSFMAFILLYIPCMATVATIKKETGSTKWTVVSIVYALILAYGLSFLIYQIGSLLGY
ncbi:MAG: ferrous iron transport protein B [Anaerobacillus sp.]|uniref:ferrous iron transport protein B n=1 Tax=Anaerobacillus sp. TaxID=1872506 RepID=UPI00391906F8